MPRRQMVLDSEEHSIDGRFLRVLFHPTAFFQRIGLDTSYARVLPYFALLAWATTVLHRHMTGELVWMTRELVLMLLAPPGGLAVNAIFAAASQWLGGHLGASAGFTESLKVYCYAFTPVVFFVPVAMVVGPVTLASWPGPFGEAFVVDAVVVLFSLWFTALVVLGMREVHMVSSARAVVMALPALIILVTASGPTVPVTLWLGWV